MPADNTKLLKNKKAVEEINRHRWIESEKAGYDIGFETAATDWLEKFSAAWMQYHMPPRETTSKFFKSSASHNNSSHKTSKATKGQTKKS